MRLQAAFIAVVLFTLPTARADDFESSRSSLRGLNGVGVVVADLKPEIEQNGLTARAIQTDVELKLRQAGIPVLDPKDNSKTPGGVAILQVIVSVLTPSDGSLLPNTIMLELRQHVTLVRDPSIITPFATTWYLSSFGRVGRENVRSLRDDVKDLTDMFINSYLAVNPKK